MPTSVHSARPAAGRPACAVVAGIALALAAAIGHARAAEAEPWARPVAIMPGRALAGWRAIPAGARFEVTGGRVVGVADDRGTGFLLSGASFGDFRFEGEVKAAAASDLGLRVRVPDPAGGPVAGVPVPLARGRAGAAFRRAVWNQVRVEARGDQLTVALNGEKAEPVALAGAAAEGAIALELPTLDRPGATKRIEWRALRVVPLGTRAWLSLVASPKLDGVLGIGAAKWRPAAPGTPVLGELAAGASGPPSALLMARPLPVFTATRLSYRLTRGKATLWVGSDAAGGNGWRVPLPAGDGPGLTTFALSNLDGRLVAADAAGKLRDLAGPGAPGKPAPLVGRVGIELAPGSAIELHRFELLSEPVPPPVPGHPVGRCVRMVGVVTAEEAKAAGFEYVEIALQDILPLPAPDKARLEARLRNLGLPAPSGYGFLPAELMVVGPARNPAEIDQHMEHGLLLARRLGLGMVVFGNLNGKSRTYPEGYDRDKAWAELVDFGKRAARAGERHGVMVLIEPLPARSTNLVNTVAEGVRLIEAVGSPNLRLLIDMAYMVQQKEDFAVLHSAAPLVRQIEISNPDGRVYPRRADEADYAGFFRALKRGGYQGGFSVHARPEPFAIDGPRALGLLRTLGWTYLADGKRR